MSDREDREADAVASQPRMTRSELINEVESQALAWRRLGNVGCNLGDKCKDAICQLEREELAKFKSNIDKLREKLGVKI